MKIDGDSRRSRRTGVSGRLMGLLRHGSEYIPETVEGRLLDLARKVGADRQLPKPFMPNDLLNTIREMLH